MFTVRQSKVNNSIICIIYMHVCVNTNSNDNQMQGHCKQKLIYLHCIQVSLLQNEILYRFCPSNSNSLPSITTVVPPDTTPFFGENSEIIGS